MKVVGTCDDFILRDYKVGMCQSHIFTTCSIQNKWILFNRFEKNKGYMNNGVFPVGSVYVWGGVLCTGLLFKLMF